MKHVRLPFTLILLSVLFLCGCKAKQDEQAEMKYTDMILKVNDTLYYGSEETGPMGDAGCIEGKIASSVASTEVPEENGASNFGCVGNPYTYDEGDHAIMVYVGGEKDGEYVWFYADAE